MSQSRVKLNRMQSQTETREHSIGIAQRWMEENVKAGILTPNEHGVWEALALVRAYRKDQSIKYRLHLDIDYLPADDPVWEAAVRVSRTLNGGSLS
jgi:hypothetical protein